MRKFYKTRRNRVLTAVQQSPFAHKLTVLEENAGLHFLLQVDTRLTDETLVARFAEAGIQIRSLSSYYHKPAPPEKAHRLVVNYSGLSEEGLRALEEILKKR